MVSEGEGPYPALELLLILMFFMLFAMPEVSGVSKPACVVSILVAECRGVVGSDHATPETVTEHVDVRYLVPVEEREREGDYPTGPPQLFGG